MIQLDVFLLRFLHDCGESRLRWHVLLHECCVTYTFDEAGKALDGAIATIRSFL